MPRRLRGIALPGIALPRLSRRHVLIAAASGLVILLAGIALWLVSRQPTETSDSGFWIELRLPPPKPAFQAADPALLADSPDGKLPIIGPDGRQPWRVYAARFDAADKRPRLAVLILGLGLDRAATQAAIDGLPPAVTLGFSPYAPGLADWLAAARKAGHEVVLGLPMEPADYPRQDPGPQTLLTSLEPEQNLARLRWVLGRAAGYVGLAGVKGDRFTAAKPSLEPILDALKSRGLIFVDSRSSADSVAVELARQIGLPSAAADRVIDGESPAPAIDAALGELEKQAQRNGAALGLGVLYPITVERVAVWAGSLEGKGIALAPTTAIVGRQPPR